MKRIFVLPLFLGCLTIQAQKPIVKFDHMALVVKDLKSTIAFYTQTLGFEQIEDPTGNPSIDWVQSPSGQQLHFLQAEMSEIRFTKSVHMSFAIETFTAFVNHLKSLNIPFEDWEGRKGEITIRQDGVRQVYIQDPNGYWIEINDNIR